jgi:hypothetical protein
VEGEGIAAEITEEIEVKIESGIRSEGVEAGIGEGIAEEIEVKIESRIRSEGVEVSIEFVAKQKELIGGCRDQLRDR